MLSPTKAHIAVGKETDIDFDDWLLNASDKIILGTEALYQTGGDDLLISSPDSPLGSDRSLIFENATKLELVHLAWSPLLTMENIRNRRDIERVSEASGWYCYLLATAFTTDQIHEDIDSQGPTATKTWILETMRARNLQQVVRGHVEYFARSDCHHIVLGSEDGFLYDDLMNTDAMEIGNKFTFGSITTDEYTPLNVVPSVSGYRVRPVVKNSGSVVVEKVDNDVPSADTTKAEVKVDVSSHTNTTWDEIAIVFDTSYKTKKFSWGTISGLPANNYTWEYVLDKTFSEGTMKELELLKKMRTKQYRQNLTNRVVKNKTCTMSQPARPISVEEIRRRQNDSLIHQQLVREIRSCKPVSQGQSAMGNVYQFEKIVKRNLAREKDGASRKGLVPEWQKKPVVALPVARVVPSLHDTLCHKQEILRREVYENSRAANFIETEIALDIRQTSDVEKYWTTTWTRRASQNASGGGGSGRKKFSSHECKQGLLQLHSHALSRKQRNKLKHSENGNVQDDVDTKTNKIHQRAVADFPQLLRGGWF
jgi:hypothetical protein